jgi:enoyl-[acyl-carrier-protein] reductase (NADH)
MATCSTAARTRCTPLDLAQTSWPSPPAHLASEVGPRRVRANCIWTAGVALEAEPRPESPAPGVDTAIDALVEVSILRKRPTLQEVADAAAFLASDRASGITASILNVSSGISSSLAK